MLCDEKTKTYNLTKELLKIKNTSFKDISKFKIL